MDILEFIDSKVIIYDEYVFDEFDELLDKKPSLPVSFGNSSESNALVPTSFIIIDKEMNIPKDHLFFDEKKYPSLFERGNTFSTIGNEKENISHQIISVTPKKVKKITQHTLSDYEVELNKKIPFYNIRDYGKTLYTFIGKTDFNSFDSIISFVNMWGIPVGEKTPGEHIRIKGDIVIIKSSLTDLYEKVMEYKKFFDMFVCLKEENYSKLLEIYSNNDGSFKKLNSKTIATDRFMVALEDKVSFDSTLTRKDGMPFKFVFNDLIEVSYFHLALAAFGNFEMRKCEYCGNYFEVTHQKQKFCPPPPTHKRSICETAYNNKKKREQAKNK